MMTEMKTNNGKRLVAAVAIFAMLACALAFVVPASDGEAFASSAENPINLDGAAISSQDDFPEGETAITAGLSATNAGLGNTEMKAEVNGTTVTISGKLNMQDITYTATPSEGASNWGGTNTTDSAKVFYDYWKNNTTDMYAVVVEYTKAVTEGSTVSGVPWATMVYFNSAEDSNKQVTIPVYIDGKSVEYTLSFDVTFSDVTTPVWGDGTNEIAGPVTLANGLIVVGDTKVTATLDGTEGKAAVIDMTNTTANSIQILNGTLTVEGKVDAAAAETLASSIYGILSDDADLTVSGAGSLAIVIDGEPTDNVGGKAASGIYTLNEDLTIKTNLSILNNVTVNGETVTAAGSSCYGVFGENITIDGKVNASIYAGNRAIYTDVSLTVSGGAQVTVGAFEKAIRGSGSDSGVIVNVPSSSTERTSTPREPTTGSESRPASSASEREPPSTPRDSGSTRPAAPSPEP